MLYSLRNNSGMYLAHSVSCIGLNRAGNSAMQTITPNIIIFQSNCPVNNTNIGVIMSNLRMLRNSFSGPESRLFALATMPSRACMDNFSNPGMCLDVKYNFIC